MSIEVIENNFFSLCDLKEFNQTINNKIYSLKTNLQLWNIFITDYRIKGDKWNITITIPYKEMNISLKEIREDKQFFSCHIARISLNTNVEDDTQSDNLWSFFSSTKSLLLKFSAETKYLLFDIPYFYPHNIYYLNNHTYLYNKILYSITMFKNFIEAYNNLFSTGIPILYIKSAVETKTEYEIQLVLTNCITITYLQTDVEKSVIYCHMFVDNTKKNTSNTGTTNMFYVLPLKLPRLIKNNNINFIFTTSQN